MAADRYRHQRAEVARIDSRILSYLVELTDPELPESERVALAAAVRPALLELLDAARWNGEPLP